MSVTRSGPSDSDRDEDLERARRSLSEGGVVRTPLVTLRLPDDPEIDVRVKLESHQRTGSFKLRGATAAASAARDGAPREVVVTASAGNHGLGLAEALERLRLPGRIFVPETANPKKVAALLAHRPAVDVELVAGSYDDTERPPRPGRPLTTPSSSPPTTTGT